MSALHLTVVSDAICPWCWIGKRRLDQALEMLAEREPDLAFEVSFFPFLLNPDMPAEGMDRASYRAAKFGSLERSRELDAQVAAAGAASGLEFRHDLMTRTPDTTNAHRLARFAAEQDRQRAVVEAIFRAYFNEGRDIGDVAVLAELAAAQGLDHGTTLARLRSDEAVAEVRAQAASASRAGITGVPSFVLNRHFLFSGAQPAETIADALIAAARHPAIAQAR
ncbi:DsbA family oxidoreductase [Elioraea sp. Yellowstone]|jgi:predicted DsbA family dithiol-disulfide isomerase|uniref:DsbA family oxidoreductase n=1 Tax=Elioraea sp. Yellowstone TaxID=2592070 RepID=UPI001154ECBA|nr:DsbA family oxidoreductase [Elioraea sp. Yellowstone]TQF82222.1 DsbA family oxidoreductase [Elioraea sp. Yellowstone]